MYNYNFDEQQKPEKSKPAKKNSPQQLTFGMTRAQLILVIVMAFFALGSMGGMAALILSTPAVKEMPPTAEPTYALPTRALPTETPLPPTETPEPTPTSIVPMTPPEGWIDFSSDHIKLFLPSDFRGGDMKQRNRGDTLDRINSMGKPFNEIVKELESSPQEMEIAAVLREDLPPAIVTNMIGFYEQFPSDLSLEDYLQPVLFQLGSTATASPPKKMTILGREAIRVEVQTRVSSWDKMIVIYAIKDDINFWRVQYSTGLNDYYTRIYDFEKSIQTIDLMIP